MADVAPKDFADPFLAYMAVGDLSIKPSLLLSFTGGIKLASQSDCSSSLPGLLPIFFPYKHFPPKLCTVNPILLSTSCGTRPNFPW